MRLRLASLFVLVAGAMSAHANLIVNGSFEDGNFVPNGDNTMSLAAGATDITGWKVVNDPVAWIADPNPFNGWHATDGVKSLDLTGYGGGYGGVAQDIATIAGHQYHLEFDFGVHQAYGDASVSVNVGTGDTGYTLHSENGVLWERILYDFTAFADTTTLSLIHNFDGGQGTGIDNVVLVETVPEPATLSLLALAPLALRRRRK
ncbi:MAG: DUF642 domain-containing protein [Armatimonadetes bacterium]|nr:DUF642 domain-containing protein [Armatimonadota bacterium]